MKYLTVIGVSLLFSFWLSLFSCKNNFEFQSFDFEESDLNAVPSGWTTYFVGKGNTDWKVVDDNGNKVFAQLQGDNPNAHFNMAVYNRMEATDVKLSVRFRAVQGHHDQGGGLIWRYKDKNNHYIVRANPLENNVVLYKMENGKRSDLPLVDAGRTYGMEVDPLGKEWHTLELKAEGDLFTTFLDGKELFQVKDSTFTRPGKVGLWTKADAVTYFDDFQVKQLP